MLGCEPGVLRHAHLRAHILPYYLPCAHVVVENELRLLLVWHVHYVPRSCIELCKKRVCMTCIDLKLAHDINYIYMDILGTLNTIEL